jgi:NADPH:quinone reductase-like Zn-dependent oxidoreductase
VPGAASVPKGGAELERGDANLIVLGPLSHIARGKLGALLSSQRAVFFVADLNRDDLGELRDLIERGDVRPVVERRYDFDEVADALRYMGEGHARGKLVISL